MRVKCGFFSVVVLLFCVASVHAADWGLKKGAADLKSAGPLAFGPDGILLVGDTKAATVFAIDTGDASGEPGKVELNIKGLNGEVASLLGAGSQDITIKDLAVNPASGSVYLSVAKKEGDVATPALVKIDATGKLSALNLSNIGFAKVALPNAPEDKVVQSNRGPRNARDESITDLAFSDGKVLVAGMSTAASPSTVREIPFPFITADAGTSIEIYHAAHGKLEDYAAVRAFVPFNIDGEPSLLAGFTCTPLVKFPLKSLTAGEKVRGTTVAELGNRNMPLDIITYQKDGKDFLLMANNNRGVMKISTKDLERQQGLTEPVGGGGVAGQPYETIEALKGVVQLDRLNDQHAIILVQHEGGAQDLVTVPLP